MTPSALCVGSTKENADCLFKPGGNVTNILKMSSLRMQYIRYGIVQMDQIYYAKVLLWLFDTVPISFDIFGGAAINVPTVKNGSH